MIDIGATIKPKSDQLNADDLIAGPRTITITSIKLVAEDQPVVINFHGDEGKPYKPCKSMRRVLVRAWGADGSMYAGRSLTLYLDETVKFGGSAVGGIRISEMSDIPSAISMALTATRGTKKGFTVKPMKTAAAHSHIDQCALFNAGDAAAAGGVEAYKSWISGLGDDEKAVARPRHQAWSATAKAVDQQGENKPTEAQLDDDERAYQQALSDALAKEDQK